MTLIWNKQALYYKFEIYDAPRVGASAVSYTCTCMVNIFTKVTFYVWFYVRDVLDLHVHKRYQ